MSTLADYSVACKAWYSEGLANLSDVENLHVFRIKDNEVADNQPLGDISMKEAIAGGFVDRIPTEEADAWIAAHGSRNIGRGNIVRVSNNNVLAEIFNNDEDSEESASTFVLVKKIEENESVSWRPLACAHLSMDLYHGKPRYVSFTFIGTNKFMRVEFDPNASALYHDLHKFFENRELFTITLGAYKGDESWIEQSLECTEFYKAELYGTTENPATEDHPECELVITGDFDESAYTHIMFEAVGVTGKNTLLCHQGKEMRCICPVVTGKTVKVDLTEVLYQWVQTEEGSAAPDVIIIRGYGMRVEGAGLSNIDYGWVTSNNLLGASDSILFGDNGDTGIPGRLHSASDFVALGYRKYDPNVANPQEALADKTTESNALKHGDRITIWGCNADKTKFLVSKDNVYYFLDADAVAYKNGGAVSGSDTLFDHVYAVPDVSGDAVTLEVGTIKDLSSSENWFNEKTLSDLVELNSEFEMLAFYSDDEEGGSGDAVPESGAIPIDSDPEDEYTNEGRYNPALIVGVYKRGNQKIAYLIKDGDEYIIVPSAFYKESLFDANSEPSVKTIYDNNLGEQTYFKAASFDAGIIENFIVPVIRKYATSEISVTYPDESVDFDSFMGEDLGTLSIDNSSYGMGRYVIDSLSISNDVGINFGINPDRMDLSDVSSAVILAKIESATDGGFVVSCNSDPLMRIQKIYVAELTVGDPASTPYVETDIIIEGVYN